MSGQCCSHGFAAGCRLWDIGSASTKSVHVEIIRRCTAGCWAAILSCMAPIASRPRAVWFGFAARPETLPAVSWSSSRPVLAPSACSVLPVDPLNCLRRKMQGEDTELRLICR